VYAKDVDADLEHLRTSHLNNDEETEIEKSDLVDGNLHPVSVCVSKIVKSHFAKVRHFSGSLMDVVTK